MTKHNIPISANQPLLSIIWSLSDNEFGYLNISQDNGLLSRAVFPAAWAKIVGGGVPLISEQEYQNEITANQVCGKFSSGDGENTFRVPYIAGMELCSVGGANTGPLGGFQPDQMRDIYGYFNMGGWDNVSWQIVPSAANGAFGFSGNSTAQGPQQVKNRVGPNGIDFHSNRLGVNYNGVTTHSRRIFANPLLKMYNTVTDNADLNIGQMVTNVTTLIGNGITCKAKGYIRGDGTLMPGSHNILSSTKISTGIWELKFINSIIEPYVVITSSMGKDTSTDVPCTASLQSQGIFANTTTSFRIENNLITTGVCHGKGLMFAVF